MKRFATVMDGVFFTFLTFCTVFLIVRYYLPMTHTIVIASAVTILLAATAIGLREKRHAFNARNAKQRKLFEKVTSQLPLLNPTEQLNLLERIYSKEIATRLDDCVLIRSDGVTTAVFIRARFRSLSMDDTSECLAVSRTLNADKTEIYALRSDPSAVALAEKYSCTIYNERELLPKLTLAGAVPTIATPEKKEKKRTLRGLASLFFARVRTKGYLFAGFLLLTSSFFMRYRIYYLLFCAICLIFAFVSYLNIDWMAVPVKSADQSEQDQNSDT